MEIKWIFLLIFGFIGNTIAVFRNGRFHKGFLGEPSKTGIYTDVDVPTLWFEQFLDHFNKSDKRTWQQRYFVNEENYINGGPIFLLIGGEAEASKRWMHEGAWIHLSKQLRALCIQLEHRFYGESHPTNDLSSENLAFLTSEQALADLANFVIKIKGKYNISESQKWIAFGGSYPGSLAAWAREKYPDLIYGAISSSGPLLAKVDFKEYFEVVRDSLASYNPDCIKSVAQSFSQVEILLRHMIGQRSLDKKFMLCDPIEESINNHLDISNFFESLASNFAGVVQYNKDNSPHATITIDEVCDVMLNTTIGPPIDRLAEVNSILLNQSKEKCLDYRYEKMISDMKNTSWNSKVAEGARQWTYQTCNEFGFYQTSSNQKESLFGDRFPVDFFIQQCEDIYSERMDSEYLERVVSATNKFYGALNPRTTNVLFVHGSIDPWHALGLTYSKNPKTPTIYINGTAHCANMYEPSENDPPQLIAARKRIGLYVENMISGSDSKN